MSPVLADHRLPGVPLLPFFCLDVELSVWVLIVGRPDLALFFLDGGGCRSRARIWESEVLGRGPGRWVIADGFILFFGTGVYFDSFCICLLYCMFSLLEIQIRIFKKKKDQVYTTLAYICNKLSMA